MEILVVLPTDIIVANSCQNAQARSEGLAITVAGRVKSLCEMLMKKRTVLGHTFS
jgi:hypothetical protein